MAVNKVEINGEVKLDLTEDNVTPKTLLAGYRAHDKSGQVIYGTASLKGVLLADNVELQDGLLIFNTDIRNYQFGICDCMVIESVDAPGYKAFVWRSDRIWRATYSSSQGYNVRTGTVSVTESEHIAHFEINLGDSGGAFYTGGVRVYGWNV